MISSRFTNRVNPLSPKNALGLSKNRDEDKAGPWKCPYHNSRMCLEIIERIG